MTRPYTTYFLNNTNDPHGNIVPFPERKEPKQPPKKQPPLLNIPPVTKIIIAVIVGLEILFSLGDLIGFEMYHRMILYYGGFTPSHWTSADHFAVWEPLTLISFTFLHGGWMHTGVNAVMMAALGSGVERTYGAKKLLLFFMGSSLIAALTHLAFSPYSDMPVIGASGGIGGLFGVLLVMMRSSSNTPNQSMTPTILVFIGISALMGLIGAPDGSSVAWIAHIGGFLGGIGLLMYSEKRRRN